MLNYIFKKQLFFKYRYNSLFIGFSEVRTYADVLNIFETNAFAVFSIILESILISLAFNKIEINL